MLLGMRSLWKAKGLCNVCLSFVSILNHRHGSTTRRTTDWTPNVSPVPLTEEGCKGQEKKLANNSYLQPWMVDVVKSSLPYLMDSPKIREELEEDKGNIDAEVSKPLKVLRGKRKEGVGQRKPTCISISGRMEG